MMDALIKALPTAVASIVAVIISGLFGLRIRSKVNKNAAEIENLKGDLGRDLEKLKAKLSHSQIVNSTQWNAEFASYQAVWKGMVAVRTLSGKLVLREGELIERGVPVGYLESPQRKDIKKKLIEEYANASREFLLAIHNNAPFYSAAIREVANETHKAAKQIFDKNTSALLELGKGTDITTEAEFNRECKALLLRITEGSDRIEALIRNRLAEVQVVNSI